MQPSGLTRIPQQLSAPDGCMSDECQGLITHVVAVARKGGQHANTS
jgi:hypothetical protein